MTDKNNYILIAGGAGYIGSHMVRMLLDRGRSVVVVDNLSTGHRGSIDKRALFVQGDIADYALMNRVFDYYPVAAVMHFCAFIEVGESVKEPLKYYLNNLGATLKLLAAMQASGVKKIIFSSSAAVYGDPENVPIDEEADLCPVSPYGWSKMMVEQALHDIALADKEFSYAALRYFNACGAHPAGGLGETHNPETHLIPNILKAAKSGTPVDLFGSDYPTKDGTCVRDYIHVVDLCRAHYLALEAFDKGVKNQSFNLGSGSGYSIKEVIAKVEEVTGKSVLANIAPRRPGDPASLVASSQKVRKILGWQAEYGLEEIAKTAWAWENNHGSNK